MKPGRGSVVPPKVRAAVRARSKGWCEIAQDDAPIGAVLDAAYGHTEFPDHCGVARAVDLHHLVKRPRLHEAWAIVHLCRRHHEMCEGPFAKGRLVFNLALAFSAATPIQIPWAIERRERKGSPLLETLASGTITL